MLDVLSAEKYIGDRPIHRVRFCGRRTYDIEMNTRTNEIRLRLQPGPRSCLGDQGIDPDHIIILALKIIEGLDEKLPCRENDITIHHLTEAVKWQQQRRERRIKDGTEGTNRE